MVTSKLLPSLLLAAAIPLFAHHNMRAICDVTHPITMKGVLVNAEWTNPHVNYYLDVTGADGKVTRWKLETAPPNVLVRRGWSRDTIRVGDQVIVTGYPAKDGSNFASAGRFVLADGRELEWIDNWGQQNLPEPLLPK